MFLNRNDVLKQMIELYNKLDHSYTHNLMNDVKATQFDCEVVRSFLFNNIDDFAKTIVEGTVNIEGFDFEFSNTLYEFDKNLFTKIIRDAIKTFLSKFDFYQILETLGRFKFYLQSITSYEMIFEFIYDNGKDTKQTYELSRKFQGMIALPLFSQITQDRQNYFVDMAKCLPVYPEDLCGSSKVLITNLGNTFHLAWGMAMDKNSSFVLPTLTFDGKNINWIVRRDAGNGLYEIKSSKGHILCWVKPLPFVGRVLPPEVVLLYAKEAKNTKWEIRYLEEDDVAKGFVIKAADHDIYLSGEKTGFVSVLKEIDLEESERCAFKFQRTEFLNNN